MLHFAGHLTVNFCSPSATILPALSPHPSVSKTRPKSLVSVIHRRGFCQLPLKSYTSCMIDLTPPSGVNTSWTFPRPGAKGRLSPVTGRCLIATQDPLSVTSVQDILFLEGHIVLNLTGTHPNTPIFSDTLLTHDPRPSDPTLPRHRPT